MKAAQKHLSDRGFLRQGMDYFEALPLLHTRLRALLLEAREAWIKLWLAQGNLPHVAEGKDSAIFYRTQGFADMLQGNVERGPIDPKRIRDVSRLGGPLKPYESAGATETQGPSQPPL